MFKRIILSVLGLLLLVQCYAFQGLTPKSSFRQAAATNRRASTSRRDAFAMRVEGPKTRPKKLSEADQQLRNLEKDSRRWFELQEGREARGELNLLENPAFYTTLFFIVPLLILVWGFASGVIPGFVPVQIDYEEFSKPEYTGFD